MKSVILFGFDLSLSHLNRTSIHLHGNGPWLYWYQDVVCLQLRPWRARLGCLCLKLAPELCNTKRAALLLLCWRSEVMRLRMHECVCVFVCMRVESFLSQLLFKAFHAALDQSQSQGIIQHKHWVQKHHSLPSHTCWIQFFRHFLTSTKFSESQQGGGWRPSSCSSTLIFVSFIWLAFTK